VSMAVLAALVIPAFAPGATAAPLTAATAGSPQQWAYGGQRWANTSVSFGNGTFTSRAYFGEQVVITETNTSATTRELEGVRTIGVSYFAQFCAPDCTSPTFSANLSLQAWQQLSAFVNLTTNATVYEVSSGPNGTVMTGVAALGIENASSSARGQLNESYSIVRGSHAGMKGSLDVNRRASMGVTFSPALGIVPWNVSSGQSWNSTSAFAAQGGRNDSYSFMDDLRGVTTTSFATTSGSVSRSGTESLRGKDLGNVTLNNGATPTVIVLGYSGPFVFGDGVFLTTAEADLFGGAGAGWSVHAYANAQAGTSAVDIVVHRSAHTANLAAASDTTGLGSSSLGSATVQGSTGLSVGSAPPPSANESTQAQPESPQQAEQASQCLMGGCTTTSASNAFGSIVVLVVVAVAIVAAIGGVVLVLTRRPRRPSAVPGGSPSS
jgi:hypothetical protein